MYGRDIYNRQTLHELIGAMAEIDGVKWIRLMYMYPEGIYEELLETIQRSDKILPYFDMPIQHISDTVLRRMGRHTNRSEIEGIISNIRAKMPEAVIRTSLIAGFPGESDAESVELKDWLQEVKLDKVGVFTYSKEEGTPAWAMKDQIKESVKKLRRSDLMLVQQQVSLAKNEAKIGKVYDVLVEGRTEDHYTGRSFEMAPEIDGEILIESGRELIAGSWVKVRITQALEYDLIGVLDHELAK